MANDLLVFNPIAHTPLVALYLEGASVDDLSKQFALPLTIVLEVLELPESKRLATTIIANTGYNNSAKRARLIGDMIDKKLEEQEGEAVSNKDLSSLLRLALENARSEQPSGPQTKIDITKNETTNYGELINKIIDITEEATESK